MTGGAPRPPDEGAVGDDPAAGSAIRLSVVVPAYREVGRIASTVKRLRARLVPALGGAVEIVVVDDGSDDDTAAAARDAGADHVIRFPRNRGKGAAVRAGLLAAKGQVLAFTDADLSYSPDQVLRLATEVEDGWDMVVGSRSHIDTQTLVRARRVRELSGRVFNLATWLVLRGHYRDTQCGLKAFSRPAGRNLASLGRLDGFAFDVELFLIAEHFGVRVREVPVELTSSDTSTVRLGVDARRMLGDLLRLWRWSREGIYGPAASHYDAAR